MDVLLSWILLLLGVNVVYSDIGYFWHVSDFHYDFTYKTEGLSCNNNPSNKGKFGNFWCDSPLELIKSSVRAMAQIKPDADFVLWTGDSILHVKDDLHTYDTTAMILDNVTNVLKTLLPEMPVYATFGNHDYFPRHQFPPNNNELYNDTWIRWKDWVGNEPQGENFRKGGYYTVKRAHGLRIVALNTNLYYTLNKATLNSDDPGDQLKWLDATLNQAENDFEKVIVTGHIPPGVHTYSDKKKLWMYPKYNTRLVEILQKYTDTVVCMHFGHDHADGFKVLKDKNGVPGTTMFTTPSVTPWRYVYTDETGPAHHPGIKLVFYDRQTFKHMDYEMYYLDLRKANRDGVDVWQKEYQASIAYNIPDLSARSFSHVVEDMSRPQNEKFEKFWLYNTVSPPADLREPCDWRCKIAVICGFENFNMDEYETCRELMTSTANVPASAILVVFVSVASRFF